MTFADPTTSLELDLHETVCDTGHIHSKHLPECPWHDSYLPTLIVTEKENTHEDHTPLVRR